MFILNLANCMDKIWSWLISHIKLMYLCTIIIIITVICKKLIATMPSKITRVSQQRMGIILKSIFATKVVSYGKFGRNSANRRGIFHKVYKIYLLLNCFTDVKYWNIDIMKVRMRPRNNIPLKWPMFLFKFC